jgi:hypothetical protein
MKRLHVFIPLVLTAVVVGAALIMGGGTFGASRWSPGGGSPLSPGLFTLTGTVISPSDASHSLSFSSAAFTDITFRHATNSGHLMPDTDNLYDIGRASNRYRAVRAVTVDASVIAASIQAVVSNIVRGGSAAGMTLSTYTTSTPALGTDSFDMAFKHVVTDAGAGDFMWGFTTTSVFTPLTNNHADFGMPNRSLKNIYASGTVAGVNAVFTGNVTSTGGISTGGPLRFSDNAGFMTAMDLPITSAAGATEQMSYSFDIDSSPWLKMFSLANGAGLAASGTVMVYKPLTFPAAYATTTVATTTKLNVNAVGGYGRIRVISASVGNSTVTSTPAIISGYDGQTIILVGTDDTRTVTLPDESSVTGSGLQLAGGANFALGAYDTIVLMYDTRLAQWIEISRSNN